MQPSVQGLTRSFEGPAYKVTDAERADLAWQLAGKAGYELMRNFDADRIAPGGEDIDKLLKLSGGGLIIHDDGPDVLHGIAISRVS